MKDTEKKPRELKGNPERLMTGEKVLEQRFHETEHLFHTILDSMTDAVHIIDEHYKIIFVNRRLNLWLEQSRLDLDVLNRPLYEAFPFLPEKVRGEYRLAFESGKIIVTEEKTGIGREEFITETQKIPVIVNGHITNIVTIIRDLTEIKKTQAVLISEKNKLQTLIDSLEYGITIHDREYNILFQNEFMRNIFGDASGKCYRVYESHDHICDGCPVELSFKDGKTHKTERKVTSPSGEDKILEIFSTPIKDAGGNIDACFEISKDITERKCMEDALRKSEKLLSDILDGSPIPQFVIGRDHLILKWNKALEEYTGVKSEEVIGTDRQWFPFYREKRPVMADLLVDGSIEKIPHLYAGKYSKSELVYGAFEGTDFFPALGKDGKWLHFCASAIKDSNGNIIGAVETLEDITRRMRAEEDLSKTNDLLRAVIEAAPVAIIDLDLDGKVQSIWNPAAEKMLGWSKGEAIGNILPSVPVEKDEEFRRFRDWIKSGRTLNGIEVLRQRRDGKPIHYCIYGSPLYDPKNRIIGNVAVLVDITERKQSEDVLREREKFLSSILENIPHMIFIKDAGELKFVRINKAGENILGYKREDLVGKSDYDFFPREQADFFTKKDLEVLESRQAYDIPEEPIDTRMGRRILHTKKIPILDKNGKPAYLLGISDDITEHKRAEEDRGKLQAQLSQAQKMESVGRLAGGVAHDFNNMLSVIIGYTDLIMNQLGAGHPLFAGMQEIRKAAGRSADLTRQLLAFARKQTVSPLVLNLNESVESMLKMLRRLIGEDIDLAWLPSTKIWPVNIDPSQVDQILANLCVNARDAISGVGRITIETHPAAIDEAYCAGNPDAAPGEYVVLSVSDNGSGMDKETLDKLFEPFFTTKESGKGTGLGLATIYGIVKQNNGFINVYSEPGHGSTFRIYLPRHPGESGQIQQEGQAIPTPGGNETILLVEDETAILDIERLMLENLGYSVLTASTPDEAIRVAREHAGVIQLLITDVIMPKMNGRELSKKIISFYPGIKLLFMSGYTGNVIAHHGVLDEGVHFMQKPFSIHGLAAKVREALDGK